MNVYRSLDIGTDFLGYRIEDVIGRGGMGVVYRAYDLRLKRPVALKLVAPSLTADERLRERFARESELVMSLEHPNVVPIYDAGDVDGRLYLAMRLVDGTDLGSLLRAEGALAPDRAVTICTQIASALDAAHARGLVHRDVKPSNVLLDSSEHVYLADFGLTRRLDDQAVEPGSERSIGTPAYLAPEQLEGQQVDGRADEYSLGCLLYECLTGESVFPRGSRLAVAWAHLEEEPPRASGRSPGLPEAIDDVISRALAKDPELRYPTCGALITAAEEALGLGRSTPLRRRKRVLLVAAILPIVIAAATVAAVLGTGGHGKAAAPLYARPDSLVRIDPTTNTVSAVIDVGAHPVVAAADGRTVWTYNSGDGTISEIDTDTNRVLKTTPISGFMPSECCSVFAGPVLAADASGAWFVNGGGTDKTQLTHVLTGGGRKREYPLDLAPTGVAVGAGSVWVVGYRGPHHEVERIDPATGGVTATTRFPAPAQVDSIAFGYGHVWVVSSSTATLYRIDPHSARRTRGVVVGSSRASRPEITPHSHDIYVRTTDSGGTDVNVDPFALTRSINGSFEPPDWGEYGGDLGALWWYSWPSGTVSRQQEANGPVLDIHVTEARTGGPCLTSMTTGSGSLWVTAAAGPSPSGGPCIR
jgi:DNA-binding beta-propeller fold protein YncE